MSEVIKVFKGTRVLDKDVTLTQYRYSDGSTDHWLFRDRFGLAYNPIDQKEADKIVSNWKLEQVL